MNMTHVLAGMAVAIGGFFVLAVIGRRLSQAAPASAGFGLCEALQNVVPSEEVPSLLFASVVGGLVATTIIPLDVAVGIIGFMGLAVTDATARRLPDILTLPLILAGAGLYGAWPVGLTVYGGLVVLGALLAAVSRREFLAGGDERALCALAMWCGALWPFGVLVAALAAYVWSRFRPQPDNCAVMGPGLIAGYLAIIAVRAFG